MRRSIRLLIFSATAGAGYALYRWLTRQDSSDTGVTATTAMARNIAVARTTAKVGASYATHQARRAGTPPEKRAELDAAFEMKTADEVVSVLGNMKGALMKIGQMASFLDDGLPEPVRDALATLQADAPPMSAALAARVVEEELGAAPDALFAQWEDTPISAASIGQVHRAVTYDGDVVAVKVQYPGVAQAITSDLDNSQMLFAVLGMMFPNLDPKPIVQELRDRLGEEVDYRLEAKNQTDFHAWYADHPFIHVPKVFPDLSSERVLTTEMATGARFGEVAETWSHDEKQLAAETIYRFVFRSLWSFHAFNGDPHPGNYLFRPNGRVTFLDFGLVKRFEPHDMTEAQSMIETLVFNDDIAGYRRIVEELGFLQPGAPLTDEEVEEYFGYFYELIRHGGGRQRVTHEYAAGMVAQFFDVNASPVPKFANMLPRFAILQRINLGLYAILARLDAEADWLAITKEIWPWAGGEPSTPLGREEAAWAAKLTASGVDFEITSPDKVMFAQRGETKADLAAYYKAVEAPLMKAMGGRPVLLQRYPNGAAGPSFFQKRVPEKRPEWLQTTVVSTPNGTTSDALVAADIAHVLWAVNLGSLGFHVWPYHATTPDVTDELRIDLDPSPGVDFEMLREAASEVKALLDELGIVGFPKTTGSRGIHIYVNVAPRLDSYQVRSCAVALAREMQRRRPDLMTWQWWKEERGARVFVDYNQNCPHKTVFGAWGVRANDDDAVSAPFTWDELPTVDIHALTMATVPARVAADGDPWAAMYDAPQSLQPLLDMNDRDLAAGMMDAPWPPVYPKQPNEPPRVAPSRAKKSAD